MTQKEKQLIIEDLCARLPYWPNVLTKDNDKGHIIGVDDTENGVFVIHIIEDGDSYTCDESIENFKPYLRPMSSMTKEEENELGNFVAAIMFASQSKNPFFQLTREALLGVFFNKHHIDYRELIPMGLALEAPEGMYKTE